MDLTAKTLPIVEFYHSFRRTGNARSAIFGSRKALMDKIFATGLPVYCDQTYYHHPSVIDRVDKVEDHYVCDIYMHFEYWRDCHYYTEWVDNDGNKVWIIKGGRYD
jgi:hypothetical protein